MVLLNDWIMPYVISTSLSSDNCPQFSSKFFSSLCSLLGNNLKTTTAYHPQSNFQTERYNKKIIARLRHYVNELKSNWDSLFQPLTYAYNNQIHISTGTTPFSLELSRNPPNPTISRSTGLTTDSTGSASSLILK